MHGLIYAKEKHNYNTRSARKNFLDIPLCQTFTYGTQSCKYQCIKDWNRFKKENSTENLTYPVVKKIYSKRIFWPPINISSQILDFLLLYLFTESQNQQRKKWNVVFFIIFFYLNFSFFVYLSESSKSSDYSCDFCQHNSRIWTTDVNVNNAMYIVPLPSCCIYSLLFLVCFLYGLGSLKVTLLSLFPHQVI